MNAQDPQLIVHFDGYCGLCNGFVDFLIEEDRKRVLRYSPLKDLDPATVVVTYGKARLEKSDAVLAIFKRLGGGWKLMANVAGVLPKGLRDKIYDLVARHRYKLFGKRETCRIPTPEERDLFL